MNRHKESFSEVFPDGILNIEESDLREDEKEFLKMLLDNLRWNITEGFLGDIIPGADEVYIDYGRLLINNTSNSMY